MWYGHVSYDGGCQSQRQGEAKYQRSEHATLYGLDGRGGNNKAVCNRWRWRGCTDRSWPHIIASAHGMPW